MALAARVIEALETSGWSVYQEVKPKGFDRRVDIVAVRGPLLHAIECKLVLGWGVLEQAYDWRQQANMVSVATATYGRNRMADVICETLGIGRIGVSGDSVVERVSPMIRRRVGTALRMALRPEHRTFARAGSSGRYFSEWRETLARLSELVQRRPHGVLASIAAREIQHHYATNRSAANCFVRDAYSGRVPFVMAAECPWARGTLLYPAPTTVDAPTLPAIDDLLQRFFPASNGRTVGTSDRSHTRT